MQSRDRRFRRDRGRRQERRFVFQRLFGRRKPQRSFALRHLAIARLLPDRHVCNDSLETFKEERLAEGVKPSTVNRTLEVARTVLTRAARVWRTNGKPWLSTAPLIEMLDERQQRRPPYPINLSEQAKLMTHLPAHLQRMVLFALNCGARDDNVCKLQWAWERKVPELNRSVFVVPAAEFKGKRPHVLVLNDVAARIRSEKSRRNSRRKTNGLDAEASNPLI
ncbi:MAG: hypothetical protein KF788_21400 [Piscinibacter sp.]|nr:hypothetical protein [Piscinibacter sp.]